MRHWFGAKPVPIDLECVGTVQAAIRLMIRAYQQWIAPAFPPACRFSPSCSAYALEAVERHGALRGLWLTVLRLLRCHPYHPGGFDPVP